MPVSDHHSEYTASLRRIQVVRDCVGGAEMIKKRTGGSNGLWSRPGTRYLPPPNPADTSIENTDRYDSYLIRASFVNFTGFTKDGMIGMAFRMPMVVELPPELEYLKTNSTGDGLHLDQLAQDIVGDVLETGRYGLLADYPPARADMTRAEVDAAGLFATIKPYIAENIINWRSETFGSVSRLVMVVLAEMVPIVKDEFTTETERGFRVLKLVGGVYQQATYDKDGKLIQDEITPKKSDGTTWGEIPFCFIGAQNNDATVDKAPLYDIAEINVSHYRNSADYEESSFIVGQPWPIITGLSQSWVTDVLKGGVIVGSRAACLLPVGANAKLVQADPNQLPLAGMEIKEKQMIMIGARIIQDSTGQETAEAAKIRFAGQNSKLGLIVTNTENGFIKVIEWVKEFMGSVDDATITMNKQFYDATIDPQLLTAQMMASDRGIISKTDIRTNMRKAQLIAADRTDEQIDQEAAGENPLI